MPSSPRSVAPLDVDGVRTAQVGTGLWGIALVVALLLHERLADSGRTWWIWTCVAGVLLGLLAVAVTARRRRRLAARTRPASPPAGQSK